MQSFPHYFRLAQDYYEAATVLARVPDQHVLPAPLLMILAHAMELSLKGHLLERGDSEEDVETMGHNLRRLWDRLAELDPRLSKSVADAVRAKWRDHLRTARDDYAAPFHSYLGDGASDLAELRILSNDTIGRGLPKFIDDLTWLSSRHDHKGSAFRYPQLGLDFERRVVDFGLKEPTVPRSISWAIGYLLRKGSLKGNRS